jgi:uncharacterized UBP type Zn finger protein
MPEACEHLNGVEPPAAASRGCEGCLALGAKWTQLRVFLNCGYVGCCEDSPHAHALRHFQMTGHPLIASLERGETWGWCYVHSRYFDLPPAMRPRRPSRLRALFRKRPRR